MADGGAKWPMLSTNSCFASHLWTSPPPYVRSCGLVIWTYPQNDSNKTHFVILRLASVPLRAVRPNPIREDVDGSRASVSMICPRIFPSKMVVQAVVGLVPAARGLAAWMCVCTI